MSPSRRLVLAAAALLGACAGPAVQRVPMPAQDVVVTRPDLTRIYFVREDTVGLETREVRILDGDREIGFLTPGTFLCWERGGGRTLGTAIYQALDPSRGRHEGIIDLDCLAGTAYYFNVTVQREKGTPVIEALDAEEGRRLVSLREPAGH